MDIVGLYPFKKRAVRTRSKDEHIEVNTPADIVHKRPAKASLHNRVCSQGHTHIQRHTEQQFTARIQQSQALSAKAIRNCVLSYKNGK